MPARPPFKTSMFEVAFTETAPAWKAVTRNDAELPEDRELETLALAGDGNVTVTPPAGFRAPR